MTIISFVNEKGGVSKSTTAVHFAYWLTSQQKSKTVLVDADKQKLSSTWLSRLECKIPSIELTEPDELVEIVPQLNKDFDFVIIDSPGKADEETRLILLRSHLTVVPVQPTGADLHATSRTLRLIKQAQSLTSESLNVALFISRAFRGTKLKEEAIEFLSNKPEGKLLKTAIHQRQVIADTYGQEATVWTIHTKSKGKKEAIQEYNTLFLEILEMI